VNDPYTTYLSMNKPNQLTKQQVDIIKKQNDGSPVSIENIKVNSSGVYSRTFEIRENDIFFINIVRI
jgi:xylan 1,4-beta-xylosidase